eukprot:scaffold75148_cov43-Attheya_sp.AAC.1
MATNSNNDGGLGPDRKRKSHNEASFSLLDQISEVSHHAGLIEEAAAVFTDASTSERAKLKAGHTYTQSQC